MTEPFDHLLEKYARLVVRVGVNVQPGQEVVINAAARAGRRCARHRRRGLPGRRHRASASSTTIPTSSAPRSSTRPRSCSARRRSTISRRCAPGSDSTPGRSSASPATRSRPSWTGLDPDPPGQVDPDRPHPAGHAVRSTPTRWPGPWSVPRPGVGPTASAWPTSRSSGTPSRPRCGSTRPTPSPPGASHVAKLRARATILNGHHFDRIRYRGPGTDLTLGSRPDSRWVGGSLENDEGVEFVPNMPTEEVFISPDWRRAEGHVTDLGPVLPRHDGRASSRTWRWRSRTGPSPPPQPRAARRPCKRSSS